MVFPGYLKNRSFRVYTLKNDISMQLEDVIFHLMKQVEIALSYDDKNSEDTQEKIQKKAENLTFEFLEQMPTVRDYIETDLQAFFDGDPAAHTKDEIIFSYPGLYAIFVYRIAHVLGIKDKAVWKYLMEFFCQRTLSHA